jgi:hypothetical protein
MSGPSLYQQVLGAEFAQLPPALRAFHALSGRHRLTGAVVIDAPATRPAKFLAWCLGAPLAAQTGAIRFDLDAEAASETWTRHFPARTMRSRLDLGRGCVVERLGPARLTFALVRAGTTLEMRLVRMQFLGVPCPSWLRPRVVARETASTGRLHFDVHASLPLVGTVASYRGHLDVPAEPAA